MTSSLAPYGDQVFNSREIRTWDEEVYLSSPIAYGFLELRGFYGVKDRWWGVGEHNISLKYQLCTSLRSKVSRARHYLWKPLGVSQSFQEGHV